MEEKDRVDETKVIVETDDNEAEQDHSGNLDKYMVLLLTLLLRLGKLDVKKASLNGDLEEEVYMSPPQWFEALFDHWVCKFQKSLYELKQSPKAWFDRFTTFVKSQGYSQRHPNHTLFIKVSKAGKFVVLIVYVDDIVLSGDDNAKIIQLEKKIAASGKLIYLSHTQSNISYAVSAVSQFMTTNKRAIKAYTDFDWRGYCTFVWDNLVTWRSKKQWVVTRSSAEAKYRAMSLGICEKIWLQKVLSNLHQDCEVPLKLFCDNKAAISITNNPVQHDRTKHVGID
ncbi:Copia protein [Cucumis melo var. makuwa]|uniref:Copia protein n=1 Tax=Cucumis melo var. makuwa TaxID=1194695 RepID=A0A5D3DQC5_CUCMM|nr:Copia protein [Cucumis melo var. makuwa]